jgi:hypothetical protein
VGACEGGLDRIYRISGGRECPPLAREDATEKPQLYIAGNPIHSALCSPKSSGRAQVETLWSRNRLRVVLQAVDELNGDHL